MSVSDSLLQRAQKVIPGGVNSPVRAFSAVEGNPPFIAQAKGCWMEDVDGNVFLDLIGSWGPMILGHAHPKVLEAIQDTAQNGTSFGAPTEAEVLFAEELCGAHPGLDMVRLCSSGTEATMHAIRLARGYTGKDYLIKIDGCYHGAHDAVLVKAGSGVATFAEPGSPGIPEAVAGLTLTSPFNDTEVIEQHLQNHSVAAIILEAVPGNMGCIVPKPGYFKRLRALCDEYDTLLIVDEVMTGFRLARGGACQRFDIDADLVALGKIVGGGLPLAAFGGRQEIMSKLSPLGAVYQAGTLSGNPLAVAAGRATLSLLKEDLYEHLESIAEQIEDRIAPIVREHGCSFARVGSMFTIFFRASAPKDFSEVLECDFEAFGRFHRNALNEGLYFPPSQYEAVFIGIEMGEKELDFLEKGIVKALRATFSFE
ncbi:MAG: glutamate-1-semialdehyde-2,1-aminomutase [Proteobacteria bacterium]|nr:glutamate-1-semialdehyde-2,1-aminomutase [Pseudomonadota bacterium]